MGHCRAVVCACWLLVFELTARLARPAGWALARARPDITEHRFEKLTVGIGAPGTARHTAPLQAPITSVVARQIGRSNVCHHMLPRVAVAKAERPSMSEPQLVGRQAMYLQVQIQSQQALAIATPIMGLVCTWLVARFSSALHRHFAVWQKERRPAHRQHAHPYACRSR